MFKGLIDWYLASLESGGYPLIALLMAMESSIVPLPSEVVIPPAAHLAASRGGMSLWGIAVAGTLGSWIGATAMYWAARWAGRPLILAYGRYVLITPDKVLGAERWAAQFGAVGIFISRLLPVVRHLIGIPAGIVRMDYKTYSIYTLVGSGIWCAVLCWIGVKAGQDQALMAGSVHRISLWVGGAMLALGAMYYFLVHRYMRPADTDTANPRDRQAEP
jgi:membrane protein DedA with SNARE-associated domain